MSIPAVLSVSGIKELRFRGGDLIWIAESDDFCEWNFLETLIPYWEKYPSCSVIESALWNVDSDGKKIHPNRKYSGETVFTKGTEFIKWKLVQSNFYILNASGVTLRRDTALSVSKDFLDFKAAGDRFFWILMLEKGDMCEVLKPLNYFRQHSVKVTVKKEYDGTQCRENYRINQYRKKKGYVRGIIRVEAFRFYWRYIQTQKFASEDIRNELLRLWFPWWQRTMPYRTYIKIYYKVYGKLYTMYKRVSN